MSSVTENDELGKAEQTDVVVSIPWKIMYNQLAYLITHFEYLELHEISNRCASCSKFYRL